MNLKLMGAILVILACGGCGFLLSIQHIARMRMLRNLHSAVEYMECELQYRCTPLPQLCRQAGQVSQGVIREVLIRLADELDSQVLPNAKICMSSVLGSITDTDFTMKEILMELGANLGNFDIPGQLQGLERIKGICRERLELLSQDKDRRIRSYQTLGLCAGAAIAILFV